MAFLPGTESAAILSLALSCAPQVQAFLYDGYWEDIGTIEAFYNANLSITQTNPSFR